MRQWVSEIDAENMITVWCHNETYVLIFMFYIHQKGNKPPNNLLKDDTSKFNSKEEKVNIR